MVTTTSSVANPVEWSARSLLETVLSPLRPRGFAIQLWDGEQWPPEPAGPADFKLIFRTPNVVRSIFPQTLLLARETVAWGRTEEVLTPHNLTAARRMSEAFDEHAHECARNAA